MPRPYWIVAAVLAVGLVTFSIYENWTPAGQECHGKGGVYYLLENRCVKHISVEIPLSGQTP